MPQAGWEEVGRIGIRTLKWGSIAAAVAARARRHRRRHRLQPDRHPAAERARQQAGLDRLLRRRQDRARPHRRPGRQPRVGAAHARCPKFVQDAHIAAEDRTFYQNNGISVGGILRAVKTSVTGETQVGGSTITQQYVKNYFLTQDRTISRKAKEILIAVKIDGQLSKSEILEKYLNTIYYGRGAYGIQSAAKAYFGKDVSKLTVAEGAVLASVINAPVALRPRQRRQGQGQPRPSATHTSSTAWSQEGWLSAADRAKYAELPKILAYKGNKFSSGPNGYITAQVKRELLSTGLSEQDIDNGGLRIVTTIDKKAQTAAIAAMQDNLPKKVQGGLVAVRPGDGAVVAMYGGADYAKSQFNTATQAIMQGASNFKPFAVLAAVRERRLDEDEVRRRPARRRSTARRSRTSATAPTAWSTCAG